MGPGPIWAQGRPRGPGHALTTRPGHAITRPGHAMTRPGHAIKRPSHAKARPGHAKARPGHAKARPGHATPKQGPATQCHFRIFPHFSSTQTGTPPGCPGFQIGPPPDSGAWGNAFPHPDRSLPGYPPICRVRDQGITVPGQALPLRVRLCPYKSGFAPTGQALPLQVRLCPYRSGFGPYRSGFAPYRSGFAPYR